MLNIAQENGSLSASVTWHVYDETADKTFYVTHADPAFSPSFIAPPNQSNGWGTLNILNAFADTSASNWTSGTGSFIGDASPAPGQATGNLPTISWLIPPFGASEWRNHPSDGAQYVAQRLDAILGSGLWDSTVIIIIYDENDGSFDHVDPQPPAPPDPNVGNVEAFVNWEPSQPVDQNEPIGPFGPIGPGYRVPAVIISPWTVNRSKKPGWDASGLLPLVNAQPCDHTAVLQLLELVTAPRPGASGVMCTNIATSRRDRFNCGLDFWNNIFDWANPVSAAEVRALLPTRPR